MPAGSRKLVRGVTDVPSEPTLKTHEAPSQARPHSRNSSILADITRLFPNARGKKIPKRAAKIPDVSANRNEGRN